jgi:hypothetical protein
VITPSADEIRDMISMREEWRKDSDGKVRVKRWISSVDGEKYLGEDETSYKEVPFVKMK